MIIRLCGEVSQISLQIHIRSTKSDNPLNSAVSTVLTTLAKPACISKL
jgi:hypothetical protein